MISSNYQNFDWKKYRLQIDECVSKKYFLDYNPVEVESVEIDQFYISKKYKILYIPISKNASTSLMELIDFEPIYKSLKFENEFDLEIPEEYKNEYKIIVITRHPKDRWISGFNEILSEFGIHLLSKDAKSILVELKNKKFIFDGHTLPQFSFIDYCFKPSIKSFNINLLKIDENFDKKLSDFIGVDIKIKRKNLMDGEYLKIKNYEMICKIFNDYCLRQQKFIDVYYQDYVLYENSK